MDRYEMVEKGDQHHNASLKPQTSNSQTKQNKKHKNTPAPAVWSKKQFIGFDHFNLINQDYMKHEVLRV